MTQAGTGTIIKQLRMARGISQMELAKALGYKDRTTIAKIESGAIEPSISKMEEIAQYFNVSLAYLRNFLERNLYALDFEIEYSGDVVRVSDQMHPEQSRKFSIREWEDLRKIGSVDAVIRLLRTPDSGTEKAPDTLLSIEGMTADKRWIVEYVMSLDDAEVKHLRGLVEFARSQRG